MNGNGHTLCEITVAASSPVLLPYVGLPFCCQEFQDVRNTQECLVDCGCNEGLMLWPVGFLVQSQVTWFSRILGEAVIPAKKCLKPHCQSLTAACQLIACHCCRMMLLLPPPPLHHQAGCQWCCCSASGCRCSCSLSLSLSLALLSQPAVYTAHEFHANL